MKKLTGGRQEGGESVEKLSELEALAKPLVDYLRQNHHPHAAIVVTDERVMVVEGVMSIPFTLDA